MLKSKIEHFKTADSGSNGFKPLGKLLVILLLAVFLVPACNNEPAPKKAKKTVVSGKIPPMGKKKEKKKTVTIKEMKDMTKEEESEFLSKVNEQLQAEHYDSAGKTDPFRPLITTKKKVVAKPVISSKQLTPLEKIGLNQIKLVTVMSAGDQKVAMVEEANGKGYVVEVGTYIGRNGGQIFTIEDNRLIIKEVYEDYKGQKSDQFKEIKLHKQK